MEILIKYPSRGRPDRFFKGMDSVVNNIRDDERFRILVTADSDDESMVAVKTRIESYPNTKVIYGQSNSKIHAVNRDFDLIKYEWDIVIVMSDDMEIGFYGFDDIIRAEFANSGLDTLLHIPDQDAKSALATMYIAGRIFYNRLGYVYNSEYESLFCDNEVMEVAKKMGCYRYADINGVIIHHNPAYGHLPKDEMFVKQQEIGWTKDQETYNRRKAINFGL